MKKNFITLGLSIAFFIVFPFPVHGEDVDEHKSSLLGGTVNQLISTTEKLVDSVKSNVNKPSTSNETVENLPTLKVITDVVQDVEEKAPHVIEQVITDVTRTTDSPIKGLVNVVDDTVDILSEVPVVTPVLTEASKKVKTVTTELQKTVKTGDETIKQVIDLSEKVVDIKPKKIITEDKPQKDSFEFPDSPEQIIIPTSPVSMSKVEVPISEIKKTEAIPVEQPVLEPTSDQEEGNIGKLVEKVGVAELHDFTVIETKKEMKNKKQADIPLLPTNPIEQKYQIVISITPMITSKTNLISPSMSWFASGDIHTGYLPSYMLLKELGNKKWYHKNSYAIIQWIHTPLRKPPEIAPFL